MKIAAIFLFIASLAITAARAKTLEISDFTKGDAIPAGASHDWNLGATGARGWMFSDKMVTTDARQIRITKVEESSPAAGVLAVGDVILGAGGKPFAYDPRTEMGNNDPPGFRWARASGLFRYAVGHHLYDCGL